MFLDEVKGELVGHILPYWAALRDDEFGGFYGYRGFDLVLDKKADKGVILHSRILWFFSACYEVLKDRECRELADHAFEYVKKNCIDYEMGGVYWMTTFDGKPSDDMKHTYNIAFAVYALSCYYNATGVREALALAERLFDDIETKTPDEYGCREAFTRDWKLADNEALSENGLHAEKTMNSVLHLIEAYTELYKANKSERVAEALKKQLSIVENKIFDYDRNALRVFFDEKFELIGDIHSYGHDIEASWLTDLAVETLGDKELIGKFNALDLRLAENIYNIGIENGALNNERENDKIDRKRVWWVQAEGVVGFVNAYQHSGDKKYLEAARSIWEYIKSDIVDKREGGEWYSEVSFEGKPHDFKEETGPWKCPYHNGRMCLEMLKRGVEL
ncbi:mannobiose 2-epimerase [Ruminococcus sp. YE71]|uniref:AGE family epimerase/isomerase n=1 Tax=unclassified Ruminococcus TaxID=2608920 RepID=UPI0008908331|nr:MULTISPECIES: AGE family epimerase/isomerase [unclassified Ruminococcus]SDA20263.1 mannobiose 2-epimerase [Ruminococcus sp. YE78]SFW32149.1 mannobiose 2-epimerase [Ruminococcus sp. YE71]